MNRNLPVIPETIRVHLGAPDAAAENVTVGFPDYIKNVASSEVYPTWPESALRANILAQISFALNRVYTEYYPSRGYDFDITNNTAFDQSFVRDRDIFENISAIVDEIFNDYIVRVGNVEPLFATYCNGTTTTCAGLSQWGTVSLANEGLGAYDILTRFYGDDITLVTNAPVMAVEPSEPEVLLRLGSAGNDVAFIQLRLNRISSNYPSIPKIPTPDGIFGVETENAVREFQRIFGLATDGIVGKATWYRIQFIYNAVKKLNELQSEGLRLEDVSKQFPEELSFGDTGDNVEQVIYGGIYTVTGISADGQWYRLKSGGYITTNKKYVSYRKELESNVGFKPYKVRVAIADLNIRKGPGTNYAKTGKYTGKGTFTIVEEKIGQGSTKGWGKLKSKAGWIALDYTTRC